LRHRPRACWLGFQICRERPESQAARP
jgi:hypothetical protein